jgi:hypothetical protein
MGFFADNFPSSTLQVIYTFEPREVLEVNLRFTIDRIVDCVKERSSKTVSREGVSCARQRLGLNPDKHYARNARKKFQI